MKIINDFINKLIPKGSNKRLFISWILKNHFYGVLAVVRSIYCTRKLTGKLFPIQCLVYPRGKLELKIGKAVNVQLQGRLHVEPCLSASGSSYIEIAKYGKLLIKNDFSIGQNVQIIIASNGFLSRANA